MSSENHQSTASTNFDWLPDAERDPHPRLTWLVECAFDVTVDALYRKEEILPGDYRLGDGTLIISNHVRDSDVPVLTTTLCQRVGRHIRYQLPFYASREDILRHGFLRDLLRVAGWPAVLAYPAGWIPLRWLLNNIVRARPIRRLREFTLKEALQALCEAGLAQEPPQSWLRESTLAEVDRRLGHVPDTLQQLSHARLGRYGARFWGLRRLRPAALRRIAPAMRETIDRQLTDFAGLLDAGRCVYFAPEGTITDDGHMGPIRSGARHIYRRTRTPPTVLPVGLSYDRFQRGRRRIVIQVGNPLRDLAPDNPAAFDAALRKGLLRQRAVTTSHLLAWYLSSATELFTPDDLADWLGRACVAVEKAGLTLDPLLHRTHDLGSLVRTRLAWLAHHRLLSRAEDDEHWHNFWARTADPGRDKVLRDARHLCAAFADWEDVAPGLQAELKV